MLQTSDAAARVEWRVHGIAFAVIALLAAVLYLPYLRNPLVFDDRVFFSHTLFSYYATHPIGFAPRAPAYFSLAFVEILFARIEAHRLLSLALHVACAVTLYALACVLLRGTGNGSRVPGVQRASVAPAALGAAAMFAVHPAAVYGAAYLIQRSIVCATLFSLLALLAFARHVLDGRVRHLVWAALFYTLAVLSKEHAILLPLVALPLAMALSADSRGLVRPLSLFWIGCAPAAIFIVLLMRQLIGQSYEPHVAEIAVQLGAAAASAGEAGDAPLTWASSVVTQAGLFFRYLATWLWPDTGRMAVDMRVDPSAGVGPLWATVKVGAFVLVGVAGGWLARLKGRAGVAGLGLLYVWFLYLVEFSVPRLQEVFVLYRSYLWGPGIALAAAAALDAVGRRFATVVFLVAAPLLAMGAYDRLQTFSSSLRLWEDAANKLPAAPVPWGSRILYEVGREYLYAGQPERAKAAADRCIAEYPRTWQCVYARGAIHLHLEEFELALPYLIRAAEMQPGSGIAQHRIGLTLEKMGRIEDAKDRFRKAVALGYRAARMEVERLESAKTSR